MKQLLHLKMKSQLALTPQLQQAIRLLQLSTFDLQQEIQRKIDSNPLLDTTFDTVSNEEEDCNFQWANLSTSPAQNTNATNESNYENYYSIPPNLQNYLRWQLELTPMSTTDKLIGTAIIDSIDDNGYLTCPPKDLFNSLNTANFPLIFEEVEAVRHRIQRFDPLGCGVNDIIETLLIQLSALPKLTPHLNISKQMLKESLHLIADHQYYPLMKIYSLDKNTLLQIINGIKKLHPKPGNIIHHGATDYIQPDVVVKKVARKWQVELRSNTLPTLGINNYYASLINKTKNSHETKFLKYHLNDALWFLKNIKNRQNTLLKVARFIMDYQKEFLEFGAQAMKALNLDDVARILNLNESTISRVTTQKYIYTPRGLFELKYFFSSRIPTDVGGGMFINSNKGYH